ncbi:ubiquitin-like-conjugating enzyme ATG10, partial [Phenoliferia sp. Uapishka_3]
MTPSFPTTLKRSQFDIGAKAIAHAGIHQAAGEVNDLLPGRRVKWNWVEHSYMPNFGYLERQGVFRSFDSPPPAAAFTSGDDQDEQFASVEEEDPATLLSPPQRNERCLVNFTICLSPTYRVPVLYFTAHTANGAPLSLASLLSSSIFHHRSSHSNPTTYPFTTLLPPSSSSSSDEPIPPPFLSQGDHPTLGTPAWFLHPCETEGIVREVLESLVVKERGIKVEEGEKVGWEREWIKTWLMIVGAVVDLRE